MPSSLRLAPNLWLNDGAEAAAEFYLSVFPNSKITRVTRYTAAGFELHGKAIGSVMTVEVELDGVPFILLNGGPMFQISEAISFEVSCQTQEQVDYYWEKLLQGGQVQACGWLKDRFGLSWQVVPEILARYSADSDSAKVERVLNAMFPMTKLIIADLQAAYDGTVR